MSVHIDPRPLYEPVSDGINVYSTSASINQQSAAAAAAMRTQLLASEDATLSSAVRCSSDDTDDEQSFRQYPLRWLVLLVFALLTITNAVLWISFAPISDLAIDYYRVSKAWINGLSMSFMALYLPGYFLSFWAMDKYGLRSGLLIAASLQTVGAWIRYLSVLGAQDNRARHDTGFVLCFIGQCLAAVAQPMFTNAPAKMSSDWFGVKQRNLATTIAAMSNPIGIAVGQLLPTHLVSHEGGMPLLLLVSACICTGTTVLCLLCVRRAPPTPPSRSTMERNQAKAEAALLRTDMSFWKSPLIGELKLLLTNKQFLILMVGVGVGLGLFNAVTTLIEQLIAPAGYVKDDAGNFGALLIGCGLVGAAIVGPIMDKTQAYNRLLKAGLVAAFVGTVFMLMSLRPGHFGLVAASFGVLGFVMLPLLPVCMECAAECTYPVSEDASSGLMLFCGNFVGIIMIVSVGELIEGSYTSVFNSASILLMCFLGAASVLVFFAYDGPLRRQAAEKARSRQRLDPSKMGEVSVEPYE